MGKIKKTGQKAVALVSSMAIIMSCATAGVLTASAADATPYATAASTSSAATKMNIYDANGKDITSNSIVYIDNSDIAGGKTSTKVTVKVTNDSGASTEKAIAFLQSSGEDNIKVKEATDSNGNLVLDIAAVVEENGKPKSLKPGTTQIRFTNESGELYRDLTVVVYEPASDMKVYFGDKSTQLNLNENNLTNQTGVMAVSNHKYQFYAEKVKNTSTDTPEWQVYEGALDMNSTPSEYKATDKAEITNDGLFTPKKNGLVTIVAKYKATETSPRNTSIGDKKLDKQTIQVQSMPKFIQVFIVKENPAKTMKITNAPTAMEAKETAQLNLEMTPTYTGSGYETGATDEIKWVSSNPKVATVDSKGLVTAVSKGDVTITSYGESDNVFAQCNIRVLTKATAISISPSPASTRVGIGVELTASMLPDTADDEIVWTSSNPKVAVVDSTANGQFTNTQKAIVTGVSKGQAIITAKAKNSGVEAKCTVNVNDKIESDNLKLTITEDDVIKTVAPNSTLNVYTSKNLKVNATLTASDGSTPDDTICWEVLDNENAYVTTSSTNKYINIKGIAEGSVRIKAYSKANPNTIYQIFKVNVLRNCDTITFIDNSVGKTSTSKSLNIGDMFSLSADLKISGNYPYAHSDAVKSWKSSNTNVATVSSSGVVTAVGNGKATITVTTLSGRTKSYTVTCFTTSQIDMTGSAIKTYTDGSMPTAEIVLNAQGEGSITLSSDIWNENYSKVSSNSVNTYWTSSDETVATVESVGNTCTVTARSLGKTTITVKSGTRTSSCLLSVGVDLKSVTIENIKSYTYSPNASSYTPKPVVKYNGETLIEDSDYTLTYANNTSVTTSASVTITGIGNYIGSVKKTFKISAKPMTDPDIKVAAIPSYQYTGKAITPNVKVTCGNVTLVKGVDYSVVYLGNSKVGTATVKITGKGNYTNSVNTNFTIYAELTNTSSVSETTIVKGSSITLKGSAAGGVGPYKYKYFCRPAGSSKYAALTDATTKETYTHKPARAIEYTYAVKVSDAKGSTKTEYFTVNVLPSVTNTSKVNSAAITNGEEVVLTASATGGIGPYKYKYFCRPEGSSKYAALTSSPVTATTYKHKPARSINYTYAVKAYDSKGNTATKYFKVKVSAKPLVNESSISATSIKKGASVTLTAKATGGTAPYKYKYFCRPAGSSKFTALTDATTATTFKHKPARAIKYEYAVKISDAKGNTLTKYFTVEVVDNPVVNNSTISATSIKKGASVTLTAKATGGTAPYKYQYFCKTSTASSYAKLTDVTTSTTFKHTPSRTLNYVYAVKVIDANGETKTKTFTVTVK